MAGSEKSLLIKRYASRRLYNTETSDYVTMEDISEFIRDGREVQIIDLKSGDDLTRQYLLQIIADHEGRGENVLPISVLTDLVRSYTTHATSMVPDFLAASFEMLQKGQSSMMENMVRANPLSGMPGMDAMRAQQEAFLKAMTGQMPGMGTVPGAAAEPEKATKDSAPESEEDLAAIKQQLADLQSKLSKMGK